MSIQAKIKSAILDTSGAEATNNWHQLLDLQTKMFLPYEVSFYLNSNIWKKAKSILDVGCGNGSYVSRISKFFPEKSYTAIDVSSELISIAKNELSASNIRFQQDALETFSEHKSFDVVIMRLVVQHLKDFPSILQQVSYLLKPGGTLLIIEPDLKKFQNWPSTPKFDNLKQHVEIYNTKMETNRCHLPILGEIAKKTQNWSVAEDKVKISPFTGPFIASNLLHLYQLWIDILEQSQILPIHFDAVRDELIDWGKQPSAYSQIGIRFLHLKFNEENQ